MKTTFIQRLFDHGGCTHIPTAHDMQVLWRFAQDKKGWVYIAENSEQPDLVKIGYTQKDPFTRAKTLKTAGVVGTFKIVKAFQMVDCISAEAHAHYLLDKYVADGEFFRVSHEIACHTLQQIWREERDALELFNVEWLLHDTDSSRWMHAGFNTEKWTMSQSAIDDNEDDSSDVDDYRDL